MTREEFVKLFRDLWRHRTFEEVICQLYEGEIAPLLERIAEKDKTIATLSEQVDTYQGKHTCFTCGGDTLKAQYSRYCPKCDRGMADVTAEIPKPDLPPPMPPVPKCRRRLIESEHDISHCQDCQTESCLRAIYKRLEVKP